MRHNYKVKKLNKNHEERRLLLSNLASSLIIYEAITTTTARAKSLASYFDKLINDAKKNDMHAKRNVSSKLNQNTIAIDKVFDVLIKDLEDRNSGYTRMYKMENRKGDNSSMSKIEIIKKEKLKKKDEKK